MTNWPLLAVTVTVDLALLKGSHSLLGESDRLLEKHHDRRLAARSNIEAGTILTHFASLFRSMGEWRATHPTENESDALLAVGYESTLRDLTAIYSDYLRLERLPRQISAVAVGLAVTLLVLAAVLPVETTDVIYEGDVVPHWGEVLAGVIGLVALTLASAGSTVYYYWRLSFTRLLERHG